MLSRKDKIKPKHKRKWVVAIFVIMFLGVLGFAGFQVYTRVPAVYTQVNNLFKQVQHPKATLDETSELTKLWQKDLATTASPVAIAVFDNKTGITTTYTNDKNTKYYMASTVKVSILAGLLYQKTLDNEDLSDYEASLAQNMIENSDNDAATALLEAEGGRTKQAALFDYLEMAKTKMPPDSWGYTTTTPADQLKLLNAIYYPNELLATDSREYIADLMGNVADSQAWGISAGATADTDVQIKNGWLEDDAGWIINSMGHIKNDQADYTIAVFTNQNETEDTGIDTIEQLAQTTFTYLNVN
ncbi:MAG: class A beta-lactamase-related serine hydrolase [Lactobacillaceae bacterium]|jgi:hypothetical protein|nr:class A beta-lactamase-related serine hydrolase [Lactobacillaceae bacterium]